MTVNLETAPLVRGGRGLDARIAVLAERQHGAFSRAQAMDVGATRALISRRLSSGRWDRAFPGVYRIAGQPPSWLREVWCALLAVGGSAVVTHETALRLHGIDSVPLHPLTFTVPHGGHCYVAGTFVHQIDDLRPHRIETMGGMRVSSAARAVVETAATLAPKRLERVVDQVLHARQANLGDIHSCFQEVLRPGKPGMAKLASVLDARGDGYVPPASELEAVMFAALAAGGLPVPRRQVALPGRGAISGIVDATYPDARLILEADGRRWHTRVDDFRRDRQRDVEAARAGWQTIRFTYAELMNDPACFCAAITDIRRQRLPEEIGPGSDRARK